MDLIQLYSATQRVVQSLETSGLMAALKGYRASLRGNGKVEAAEQRLSNASNAYIEKTAMFGKDEAAVVNLLHLGQIGTASFWIDLTSNVRSVEMRQAQAVSAYSKIMFATNHLPSVLGLVRETSAVEGLRTDDPNFGQLVLRLYDSIEPASSPDRMSRLIDAVDMLYTASAAVADVQSDTLRLMSVSGVAVRSVVFHGDVNAINATHRIIADLNQEAVESLENNNYSVESIASNLPFRVAILDLRKIRVIEKRVADDALRNAKQGAIMLLECGAQLVDPEESKDAGILPVAVVAKLDADAKSFDSIDGRILDSIEGRYDQIYDHERAKLINDSNFNIDPADAAVEAPLSARGERTASKPVVSATAVNSSADSIDDLIIDLNRLYGEQR